MKNIFKCAQILTMKLCIHTIGKLSDGIALANKEGFISGKMIDYVYNNKPSGKFFIGKLIDKIYLQHPGWQGIRSRKENLVEDINKAIKLSLEENKSIRICDVASGPAKYILEVLEQNKNIEISAEIRDLDSRWLIEAKENAQRLRLNLDYKVANALKESDFIFDKKPNIIVSSGFYDWFKDNELIKKSMKLIYDTLPKGGYFVFTNQSGHADLTMVNAVFKDFNHNPLDMTVRSAEEINSWAKEIGFTILETKTDKYGYYSNTLAIKQ